jgi:hypothetical protein
MNQNDPWNRPPTNSANDPTQPDDHDPWVGPLSQDPWDKMRTQDFQYPLDKGMGRVFKRDLNDDKYPVTRALELLRPEAAPVPLPRYRYWWTSPTMDQGRSSMCVAYTWRQWLNSAPVTDRKGLKGPDIYKLYTRSQQLDGIPGEAYLGTTVRGGAKALQELGLIANYFWANTAEEVRQFLLIKGTVAFGTNWYRSMFKPKRGVIGPIPSGDILDGGHAYLCTGYNNASGLFRFVNSWGINWGSGGRFYIPGEIVDRLIREDGEACCGLEVKLPL